MYLEQFRQLMTALRKIDDTLTEINGNLEEIVAKHAKNEYGSGGEDELKRKALEEHARNGGFPAGNQDDSQRGRGNADGESPER